MRKLALSLMAVLVAVTVAACSCKPEQAAVDRLGEQQEKLFRKYSAYVTADPKLDAKAKDDEMKLLDSLRSLLAALKGGF